MAGSVTNSELVRRYVETKDAAAFEEIYGRYSSLVYSLCLRMLGDSAEAEDVMTACFMAFVRKAHTMVGIENLGSWFYWCAFYAARNAKIIRNRRLVREKKAFEMERIEQQKSRTEVRDVLPEIEEEIARLPAAMRGALVMQFYEGLTRSQIAERLGCPEGTVGTWLARGIANIRKALLKRGAVLTEEDMATGMSRTALLVPVPAAAWLKVQVLLTGGAGVAGSIAALADKTIHSLLFAQIKTGLMVAASVAVVGSAALAIRAGISGSGQKGPVNSLFNPADYPLCAATLNVTSGSILIDTKDGVEPPILVIGSVTNTGRIVTNQSGNVVLGLLNFNRVSIASGVTVTVTGNLGLVIGSMRGFEFYGVISGAGGTGSVGTASSRPAGGRGGAGGEGGARGSSCTSAPPSSVGGNGGAGGCHYHSGNGVGFGGGQGYGNYDMGECGGGGGYGGAGGGGSGGGWVSPRLGGTTYGDVNVTDLYGGSGGGGGFQYYAHDSYQVGGGGGGGGAIEFVSLGTMTFCGTINARGGNGSTPAGGGPGGGGGSGGAVILAAQRIFGGGGAIDAQGGTGATGAGGGGGGRILICYRESITSPSNNVSGGAGGGSNWYGSNGTCTVSAGFPFKEVFRGTVLTLK